MKIILLLLSVLSVTTVNSQRPRECTESKRCGECANRDCDTDKECRRGLLCADEHKRELIAVGLDPRKAYCGNIGPQNIELCYDPNKVGCNDDSDCPFFDTDVCKGHKVCDVAKRKCVRGTPLDCSDSDACTVDLCDPVAGCKYEPLDCNDTDACTVNTCNPFSGCVSTPLDCTDSDECTVDLCDPLTGCTYVQLDCNDTDACTIDTCDPVTGCGSTPLNCSDSDACTVDLCDPLTGCNYVQLDCNDTNACTVNTCDPLTGCGSTPLNCSDSDACTDDSCDPVAGCINTPKVCGQGEGCENLTGQCTALDLVRPCMAVIDESSKTVAYINATWLSFRKRFPLRPFCLLQPVPPPYGTLYMPPDFLNDTRAVYAKVNRDKGRSYLASDWYSLCGFSKLHNIEFISLFVDHTGSMTESTVEASIDLLDKKLAAANITYCSIRVKADGHEDWISPFNKSLASTGGVGELCYDPTEVACKDDIDCPDDDNVCNGDRVCDIVSRTCVNTSPLNCNDNDSCTVDACDNITGCSNVPYCDDANACTIDSCNGTVSYYPLCSYRPLNCDDGNLCTYDSCDPVTGCSHTPNCDDGNACTIDSCDPATGCSHTPITCPASEGCDIGTGECKAIDSVRPCIAVTESPYSQNETSLNANWLAFRTAYPLRPFCLLQVPRYQSSYYRYLAGLLYPTYPTYPTYSNNKIYKPNNFLNDTRVVFAAVNRDNDSASLASDWLTICGFKNLPNVDFIALYVDDSSYSYMSNNTYYGYNYTYNPGSSYPYSYTYNMYNYTVTEYRYYFPYKVMQSLTLMNTTLTAANKRWCSVYNGSWTTNYQYSDWISRFTKSIGTIDNYGVCA